MTEVAHDSCVQLWHYGPETFLVHQHTGEVQRLDSGQWMLEFEDGVGGLLRECDGETTVFW
eukprot:4293820-Amphidinium_carterae.1